MVKIINFACTANRGRSPIGELIANNVLQDKKAFGKYRAISSGTHLDDEIKLGELSAGFMLQVVGIARDRGDIYSADQIAQLDEAIANENTAFIRSLYEQASKIFIAEEHRYRAEILPTLGLLGDLKATPDQTMTHPNQIAILTMAQTNYHRAIKIHQDAGYKPIAEQPEIGTRFAKPGSESPLVAVLSAYAHQDPAAEVPNAFGKDKTSYRASIDILMADIPLAIERLLKAA